MPVLPSLGLSIEGDPTLSSENDCRGQIPIIGGRELAKNLQKEILKGSVESMFFRGWAPITMLV